MWVTLVSLAFAAALAAAAGAKAADRGGSVVALATYGLGGRLAAPAWAALVALELAVAASIALGVGGAAAAGAALLAAFALAQAAALIAGRGGAPCGCLGGRGRLSALTVVRAAVLAGGLSALAAAGGAAAPWPLAAAVLLGAAAAGALWRRAPEGALDVVGEGPSLGEPTCLAEHLPPGGARRLVVFTSHGCGLCRRLRPAIERLRRDVDVVVLDEERDAAAWHAARVPGSPYAVMLAADDTVLAKGTVNTRRQLRSLVPTPATPTPARAPALVPVPAPADGLGRRAFLARTAGGAAALSVAPTVGSLVKPGEAEAYHFCGHIYTTDSCPHPTGLPRIDARGFPLRAKDGRRVDDLGRLIDRRGNPVDEDGEPLADADGAPLPPAPRTRVCTATGREYRIPVRVDGAWYRCCKGRVRKLVDCCSTHPRRINGDRALRGYCYANRKVFCVMYFQTRVPC